VTTAPSQAFPLVFGLDTFGDVTHDDDDRPLSHAQTIRNLVEVRNKLMALDFATQLQEMKAIAGQPDYALGSVHAVTRDGALIIASASGSQLASYAWRAANDIFVIGAQKLVPSPEAARERIYQHSLKLEDARAYAAYGQNSSVGKVLEIHQEAPGRIHIVIVRQSVGF
jgi:hypothetical protein